MTASSTPCSRSQPDNRHNSLAIVPNRRRSGFSSGALASITITISTSYLVGHCFLPAWKRQNARNETSHTVTWYHPSHRDEWRDTDWFKTRVPGQTLKRPHFIQSLHDLHRPTPDRLYTRQLDPIFIAMGRPQAHAKL